MKTERKLIRRNAHKKIAKMFADAKTAKVYCYENNFSGEDCTVDWVKTRYEKLRGMSEIFDNGDGTYTIRMHSNLQYRLNTKTVNQIIENDPSMPTPEQRLRWRQMAAWEDATETVERRQWELDTAKKNLKDALAKEKKVREMLGPLSALEGAC